MRIVIDTNVVISGVFFGGLPRKIIEAAVYHRLEACATAEISEEYRRIVEEMIRRKQGKLRQDVFSVFIESLRFVEAVSKVEVCRDPDDDKFFGCAKDAGALYIVSGDKDLLNVGNFEGITVMTAAEFCGRYLRDI